MIGEQIAAEALEWIGTPFVWQARLKHVGCDCKGLVAGVAKACGRAEGDSLEALRGDYSSKVPHLDLKAGLRRLFDRVSDIQPGDILLMRIGREAIHLGIAISDRQMVHCYSTGPQKVIQAAIGGGRLDSIWRWRDGY